MAQHADDSQLPGDVFRDAFNASPIGIVLEDLEGRPLFVNRAFCSMFGLSESEALGKHCVDFSPAEDAEKDWALFGQLRAGEIEHYHLDKRYVRRDGSLFWGRVSISLLNHRPSPMVIGIVEDITQRQVAQQTLDLATQEMIGVTRCSRDLRYVWVSPAYAAWLGRPPEDVVGRTVEEMLGADAFRAMRPHIDRVLAGENVTYEIEVDFPLNGRRWKSATYTPSRDASGNVDGWVAVVLDVTDRKRMEKERLRNAAIVESTDDAVLSMDQDGIILTWNRGAQRVFGYTETEAVGRPVTMLVPEELRDQEHDNICQRLRSGEHIERLETRRVTKDGRRIDVSLTISPLFDERGEIAGSCDIARDMSERKQFETSLLWHMQFERLLSDLSRTFISLPDDEIDANVERALARIGTFLGIDRIAVYGLSPERTRLTVSHAWTVPGVMQPPESFRPAELPYWANKVLGGEVAVVSNADALPQAAAAEKEFLGRFGAVSAASIPLIVGGEITGAISFVTLRREVSWTDDLVRQLRVISDIFSNAFKRKQGMAALRAAHAMADAIRSSFSRRLIEAQEEERTAVGRELHDDINQRVGLAILNLESLKSDVDVGDDAKREIAGVVRQLGELSGDIQALSRRLHGSRLDQMGLKAAAESFCREVAAKHKVDVQFHADGIPHEMQSEIALCLFRVLQEAVQNSTKHSGATQLEVSLAGGPEEIRLTVRDSGAGFDLHDGARGDGIGLANMRERLRLVRGDLWIESAPGRGTVMQARVPLVPRGNAAGNV